MDVKIAPDWKEPARSRIRKPYFADLTQFVRQEYATRRIYPRGSNIFRAFDKCPFDKPESGHHRSGPLPRSRTGQRTLLLGRRRRAVPALAAEYLQGGRRRHRNAPPATGNLDRWAEQGVLLLNAVLTVRAHEAASHAGRGWETFTDAVVRTISERKQGIVYMLWGSYAQKKAPSPIRSGTSFSRPYTRRRSRSTADSSVAATSRAPTNISAASARSRSCGNN